MPHVTTDYSAEWVSEMMNTDGELVTLQGVVLDPGMVRNVRQRPWSWSCEVLTSPEANGWTRICVTAGVVAVNGQALATRHNLELTMDRVIRNYLLMCVARRGFLRPVR